MSAAAAPRTSAAPAGAARAGALPAPRPEAPSGGRPAALPLREALRVALTLLALTALTALAVRLAAAAQARELLGFDFPGVPDRLDAAAAILVHNARVLGGVLAACAAVRLGRRADGATASASERVALRVLAAACDGALLVACSAHVLLAGAAYGAYGTRTVAATALHGPPELAAFALALGLYLRARRACVSWGTCATTALAALALLTLAALLEAFA